MSATLREPSGPRLGGVSVRLVGALVALLAGRASFFAAELVGTAAGMRGAATQACDFALLFRGHRSKTAQAALRGGGRGRVLHRLLHGCSCWKKRRECHAGASSAISV